MFRFIADYFAKDGGVYSTGGAELDNDYFIDWMTENNHPFSQVRSRFVYPPNVISSDHYLIANFFDLPTDTKEAFIAHGNYIIWEHDHKYSPTRDVTTFPNFTVPEHRRLNLEFYRKAKAVFGVSKLHADVINRNIEVPVRTLGTCFWSDASLNRFRVLANTPRDDRPYAILQHPSPHKNMVGSIREAARRKLPYELLGNLSYEDFINRLATYRGLVFMPGCFETFSRLVAEALMMGLDVITDNTLLGIASEPWYGTASGSELIDLLRTRRDQACQELFDAGT